YATVFRSLGHRDRAGSGRMCGTRPPTPGRTIHAPPFIPWSLTMRATPLPLLIATFLAGLPALAPAQEQPRPAVEAAPPAAQDDAARQPDDEASGDEAEAQVETSDDPDAVDAADAKVPLDEIRRYVMVYNAIRQAYVDPVDDHALMQSA